MTRYVIGPDVALRLAREGRIVSRNNTLFAPPLLRSQTLSRLFSAVREERLTESEARRQLDGVRALKIRYLGDRVLQDTAWTIARQLGWPDTLDAEFLALTQLQADAFITLDAKLARAAKRIVNVAPLRALG